ncbi:hypothetical protein ACRALDRAFT_210456 [Sodiomyces alcalophilus JCM 7366]|uniref:mitochondrial 54S ribosomal mL53 domain-containing protein n=1 Tax=Sodiomyces alcalophilus JCM 7366 TaxID=591952 RepID=UPI0039B515C5
MGYVREPEPAGQEQSVTLLRSHTATPPHPIGFFPFLYRASSNFDSHRRSSTKKKKKTTERQNNYPRDSVAVPPPPPKMITKFMTEIRTRFNPFSPSARSARLFLSRLPPNARANGLVINTDLLPKSSKEAPSLYVKFKDGREMTLDCEKIGIKGLVDEVDRHSRSLQKQADLTDAAFGSGARSSVASTIQKFKLQDDLDKTMDKTIWTRRVLFLSRAAIFVAARKFPTEIRLKLLCVASAGSSPEAEEWAVEQEECP